MFAHEITSFQISVKIENFLNPFLDKIGKSRFGLFFYKETE